MQPEGSDGDEARFGYFGYLVLRGLTLLPPPMRVANHRVPYFLTPGATVENVLEGFHDD